LKSFKIFKSEIKKLKTYSGWCTFKGLSNDTTLVQIQSGRTVPLKTAILNRWNDCIASKICEKDQPIQSEGWCQYQRSGQLEFWTPVRKTNHFKSYLGRCLRDCTVKIAEKSLLEAATGLLSLVHRRTLLAVAERFAGVDCSLITSLD
jgi:hypothetical protein